MANDPSQVSYEVKPTRNAAVALITGVLVIASAFLAYKYFANSQTSDLSGGESTVSEFSEEESDTTGSGKAGSLQNGKSAGANAASGVLGANSNWTATDYKEGDVTVSSYTVKSGDTLWEIAEAKYGDGFQWTKILDANKSSVGFLPNGRQALIEVGQVLVLP